MSSQEVVFYQDESVLVTNTRAVLGKDTYAMANITSVRTRMKPANRLPGIIVAAIGGLMAMCCGCSALGVVPILGSGEREALAGGLLGTVVALGGALFGLLVLAGGIALAVRAKPTYVVVIGTAGGEVDALGSKDSDYVSRIVNALNEAIIHRG